MKHLLVFLLFLLPFSTKALELKSAPLMGSLEFKSMCLRYSYVEKSLKKGREKKIIALLSKEDEIIEVWVNSETETWTMVLRSAKLNVGCILSVGVGVFQIFGEPL